jgi:hypothetical protein
LRRADCLVRNGVTTCLTPTALPGYVAAPVIAALVEESQLALAFLVPPGVLVHSHRPSSPSLLSALMRRIHFALALAVSSVSISARAHAQLCTGGASLADRPLQLSAGGEFGGGSRLFQGGLTYGSERGFGGLLLGGVTYDDFRGTTFVVGGHGGIEVPIGAAQLCPIAAVAFGLGPNNIEGSGIDASSQGVSAGLSFGIRTAESPQFYLVPTIGLSFAYSRAKLSGAGESITDSNTYGVLGAGLGFVFSKQVTLQPSVNLPIGLEDSDPTFGIAVGICLGGHR